MTAIVDHYENIIRKSKAITDHKEFPGRTHYTLGQDGWEEVAEFALTWASDHAATNPLTARVIQVLGALAVVEHFRAEPNSPAFAGVSEIKMG